MKNLLLCGFIICFPLVYVTGKLHDFHVARKPYARLTHRDNLTRAIAFHPESSEVAVAGARGVIDIIKTADGQRRLRINAYDNKPIFTVAYTGDGKFIAAGVWGKAPVRIFDSLSGTLVRQITDELYSISLDFSPDNRLLASSTENGTVRLYSVSSGKLIRQLHKEHAASFYPYQVRFSPDGKHLACVIANRRKGLMVWNTTTGRLVKRIITKDDMMRLAFSNDGSMLAIGGGQGRKKRNDVYVYNVKAYKLKKVLHGHHDYIYGLAFSPDSRYLVTASWEPGVRMRVWNIASGRMVQLVRDRGGQSEALAISSDGRCLAFRLRTLGNLGNPSTFQLYKTSLAGDVVDTDEDS